MRFEFATASRIVFGAGTLREAAPMARQFGARALVVTGRDAGRAEVLLSALKEQKVGFTMFSVAGEPEIKTIEAGVALAQRRRPKW